MADIELVIKIPEEVYEMVMNTGTFGIYRFNASKAIRNGTPLPKGHGDLIDRSEVEKLGDKLCIMECVYCTLEHCFYHEARPIIKADKAESEG